MKETREAKLLRFIKQETLYPKLKEFLKNDAPKQDAETLEIQAMLGTTAKSPRQDKELKDKFTKFMQATDAGTNAKKGTVLLNAIPECVSTFVNSLSECVLRHVRNLHNSNRTTRQKVVQIAVPL